MALGGTIIMAVWGYVEASFGDRRNLPWEMAFTAIFLAVLVLNASGAHRAARLLAGRQRERLRLRGRAAVHRAVRRDSSRSSGWRRSRCCCSAPRNGCWRRWAPLLPALLFAACKSGLACDLLGITPRPAPDWYFAANAVTTFALAFLVPFFFFRSNVRAEAVAAAAGPGEAQTR